MGVRVKRGSLMMIFREGKKDYRGTTAVEIVAALESDASGYPHPGEPLRRFLKWSLHSLSGKIPPRDMHLSKRMNVEELALSYLYLRDEYGAGELFIDRSAGLHTDAGRTINKKV